MIALIAQAQTPFGFWIKTLKIETCIDPVALITKAQIPFGFWIKTLKIEKMHTQV
jgi:hypothetical protein